MPRVKTGVVRRHKHKKVLKLAKGYRGANSRLFKRAQDAVRHAGQYAYIGRKLRKRDFRALWITRINAGLRMIDKTFGYAKFIQAMKKAQILIDRKILAEIAATDFSTFKTIVQKARE